jgi:hypothetical protein
MDVTAQRESELAGQGKEEAEEAKRAKSLFWPHEPRGRSPQRISGLTEMALSRPQRSAAGWLGNVHDAAKHLFVVVGDILDSRHRGHKVALERVDLDLHPPAHGPAIMEAGPGQGLSLSMNIHPTCPASARGPGRLRQVLATS